MRFWRATANWKGQAKFSQCETDTDALSKISRGSTADVHFARTWESRYLYFEEPTGTSEEAPTIPWGFIPISMPKPT